MMFAILVDKELGPPRLEGIAAVTVAITSSALDLVSDHPSAITMSFLPSSNGPDLTSRHVT